MLNLFWIYMIELLIICIATFLFELRYLRKGARFYVNFFVFVGWLLGFIIMATLPYDIYTSSIYDQAHPTDTMKFDRDFMIWNWRVSYMLTFLLTWFVFPFLMVYVIRGEFSRLKKIWKTIVVNIIYYIAYIVFIAIIIPVIYLLVNNHRDDNSKVGFFDVCYILSTMYGLLLIVFLMSYGMVAVPKYLWKISDYKARISTTTPDIQSQYNIIKGEIDYFKKNNKKFDDECANLSNLSREGSTSSITSIDLNNVTLEKLEIYRSNLIISFGDYERIHAMLHFNLMTIMELQARVNAKESEEFRTNTLKGCKKFTYGYLVNIHPYILKIFSVLTAILSLMLLYAEFTNFINIKDSLFNWIFNQDLGYFPTYILLFVPLFYMVVCTYFGLFSVKLASWYELYKGHSDPVSMLWSGTIFARLIYPMSYNFISILKVEHTSYADVLGILDDFTVFGDGMNKYFFPIVLIIFFLMNLFNLWVRLFNLCGISQYAFDEAETESRVLEGKLTLAQHRKDMYYNGEIDEVFLRSSFASDSEDESSPSKKIYAISSGLNEDFVNNKPKNSPDEESKGDKKRRKSFKIKINDDDSSNSESDSSSKKVVNFNTKNVRIKEI